MKSLFHPRHWIPGIRTVCTSLFLSTSLCLSAQSFESDASDARERGDRKECLRNAKKAVEESPDYISYRLTYAEYLSDFGCHRKALRQLDKIYRMANEYDEPDADDMQNYGDALINTLLKQGRDYQAGLMIHKVLTELPMHDENFYNVGLVYYYKNEFSKAAFCFAACYDRDPSDTWAAIYASRCYRLIGDTAKTAYWTNLTEEEVMQGDHAMAALAHFDRGRPEEARQVAENSNGSAHYQRQRAVIYALLGEKELCREQMEREWPAFTCLQYAYLKYSNDWASVRGEPWFQQRIKMLKKGNLKKKD